MKLGIITSIFDGWTFEEMIDEVSRIGYETIEVASWPQGKAERRYAGVTHVDAERVLEDDAYAQHLLDYAAEHHVQIGALAYYPNNMDADLERRRVCNEHLVNVIHAAKKLGVPKVTSFIGRMTNRSLEENLDEVGAVWNPIMKVAEDEGILVAIENCPMLFDETNWPGGQNIMTSPANWRRVFERVPSPNLGIAIDPSHFVWQMIDCDRAIRALRPRFSTCTLKTSSCCATAWPSTAPWPTRWTSWCPRFLVWAMWTGAHSCLRLPRRALTVTLASRSKIALLSRAASACLRASNNPIGTCASL